MLLCGTLDYIKLLIYRRRHMNKRCLTLLILLCFLTTFCLSYSIAQNPSQFSLPDGATTRFGKGSAYQIQYAPDSKYLAVASSIGIWLYDTTTYREIALLTGHTENVTCIDFSPDGKTLASGSRDKTVRLWDVATREHRQTLNGHLHEINSIAFSPDGKTLASGSTGERDGLEIFGAQIIMWDTATGEQIHTLTTESQVNALVFNSDGKMLASGEDWRFYPIRLWDTETGEQIYTLTDPTLRGRNPFTQHAVFFGVGNILIRRNSDDTISVYDINKLKLIRIFTEIAEDTFCATVSSDKQTLATGNIEKTIQLWDMDSGELKRTITVSRTPKHIAFSPDNKTLTISMFGETIDILDVATGNSKHTLSGFNQPIRSIALNPDKNILAIQNNVNIELWNMITNEQIHTLTGHIQRLNTIVFSPDAKTLASGSDDNTIRLWDVDTGKLIRTLEGIRGHSGPIKTVAFSPNAKTLASGSADSTIHLWDVNTGRRKIYLPTPRDSGHCVVFSPDGKTLVSGGNVRHKGEDHSFGYEGIQFWHVRTGKYKDKIKGKMGDIFSLAFSPDGQTLASGEGWADYAIRLWDFDKMKLMHALKGHTGDVYNVTFSPDGSTLASGSADNTIHLWDVVTGKHLHTFTGHTGSVNSVVFSKDGRMLISGSEDGTVLLWNLTSLQKGK